MRRCKSCMLLADAEDISAKRQGVQRLTKMRRCQKELIYDLSGLGDSCVKIEIVLCLENSERKSYSLTATAQEIQHACQTVEHRSDLAFACNISST